jgi:hypothetical protein
VEEGEGVASTERPNGEPKPGSHPVVVILEPHLKF